MPTTRWHQGYVTDVEYTAGFVREMTPSWLAFVALLLGQRAPDPEGKLAVADLGCGQAITDAVVASVYPAADVWAFDLSPTHVEAARRLAGLAGLANLHVEETDFATLAETAPGALPRFDIVTLHGVWSWVAPAEWDRIVAFIDRFLRPGGLVYVSYNTLAGWAAMLPLQRLMVELARARPERSDEAARAAVDFIARLRDGNATYFTANPGAFSRFEPGRSADPRYLAHEYLNEHWHPVAMPDVAAAMARAKCNYLGSATIPDNVLETSVPPALLGLVRDLREPGLREMVADLASARGFRRDIYRRGLGPLTAAETRAGLERLRFLGAGDDPAAEVTFDYALGQVSGKPEVYGPLLARLAQAPMALTEATGLPGSGTATLTDAVQAFALLVSSGRAWPMRDLPGAAEGARRLNRALAGLNAAGVDRGVLAAPAIGAAIATDPVDVMVVGELLDGAPADPAALAGRMQAVLARAGRAVTRGGAAIENPAEARAALEATVGAVLAKHVPRFRRVGILAGEGA